VQGGAMPDGQLTNQGVFLLVRHGAWGSKSESSSV
jgi:hypothetical protein